MWLHLLILGTLIKHDGHPYEIKKILMGIDPRQEILYVADSKLYYNFEVLEGKKLIMVKDIIRDGARPSRTVYCITEAGKKEFEKKLLGSFAGNKNEELYIAVGFMDLIDSSKIVPILTKSIEREGKELEYYQNLYNENSGKADEKSNLIFNFVAQNKRNKIRWLEEILQRISS